MAATPRRPRGGLAPSGRLLVRGSGGRGRADIEAGERGVSAVASNLDGFELVEGLEPKPVEVGLVAHDGSQRLIERENASGGYFPGRVGREVFDIGLPGGAGVGGR